MNGAPALLGALLLVACGSRTFLTGVEPDDGLQEGAGSGSVGKGGSGGTGGGVAKGGSGGSGQVGKGGSGSVGKGGSGAMGGSGPVGKGGSGPSGSGGSSAVGGAASGGAGGSGNISPQGGNTGSMKCGMCLMNAPSCLPERAACKGDAACSSVLGCIEGCEIPKGGGPELQACYTGCASQWEAGGEAYYALAACWFCDSGCESTCSAPAPFCKQFEEPPPPVGGNPDKYSVCQYEILESGVCADEVAACAADATCDAIRKCLESCDDEDGCGVGCFPQLPPPAVYVDVARCVLCGTCDAVCKVGQELCGPPQP